jgi:F0F1-type ATP synthase assembly protein I
LGRGARKSCLVFPSRSPFPIGKTPQTIIQIEDTVPLHSVLSSRKKTRRLIDFHGDVLTIPPRGQAVSGHPTPKKLVSATTCVVPMDQKGARHSDQREMGYHLALAQVGLEMVAPLVIGLVIDWLVGTMPWFAMGGLVLGFVGGLTHLVLLSKKHDAMTRKDRGESKPP